MRTAAAYILVFAALAAMIWAVSFGRLPPADFTFCNGDEIKTVDPARVTGAPEGRIVRALFEGLCRWDPKTLRPIPGAAESWEISDDGLTYTFQLRDDALWSDGTPVTAEDFAWSFRRFLHPRTAAEYAYEMWYVDGAEAFTTGKVAPGDAVEVELLEQPPGARPFAAGRIVRGELLRIEQADEDNGSKVYVVEVGDRVKRFQKGTSASGSTDYRWLLPDFREVGIRAVDRHTLVMRLKHPVPYFLNLMGFYPMFPVQRRCVETHGFPAWTKPENIVTNGPFRLKWRRIRDRIRLIKSPTYWDREHVHLDVVDALAVSSYATMLNLYLTGQADWILSVPPDVIPELIDRPQDDFKPAPFLGTYYYMLNTRKPPLDDPRVRRALAMAIDKRQIVEKITRAGQEPARSLVPSAISGYVDYRPALCEPYDVDRARELLAEAGYPGGRGMPKIDILYNTSEAHQAIAELIQAQWTRTLGVRARLQNQEWAAYLSSRRRGDYQVARAAWIGDYLDPNTFLDMFVTGGANNNTGWSNLEYDRLVEQAQQENDAARRMELFHRAERILMDEMPIIPIYFYVSTSMVRPYVKGFYPNIQDVHPLVGISIDRELKARILGGKRGRGPFAGTARRVLRTNGPRPLFPSNGPRPLFPSPISAPAEGLR
jgi:oligopeptide transport system substrate-binding protein